MELPSTKLFIRCVDVALGDTAEWWAWQCCVNSWARGSKGYFPTEMIIRPTSQIHLTGFQFPCSPSRSSLCFSTPLPLLHNESYRASFPFLPGPMLLLLCCLDAPLPSDLHLSYPSSSPLFVALAFSLLVFRMLSAPSLSKHSVTIALIKRMKINNIFRICDVSRFATPCRG